MGQKRRIDHLDVAKGISMLAIMVGHMGFSSPHNVVYNLVFQFHVPLFFILAGYTLSKRRPIGEFVQGKAHRLLVPYAIVCAILIALTVVCRLLLGHTNPPTQFFGVRSCVEACLTGAGSFSLPLPEGQTIVGAIWFLEALFWALLEVRLCLEVPRLAPFVVCVLFVVGIKFTTRVFVPLNILQGTIAALYVYLGWLARNVSLLERDVPLPVVVVLSVVAIVAAWSGVYVSLVRAYLGPHCIGFVTSLTTSLLVVLAAKVISDKGGTPKRLLVWVGRNSLVFLGVHLILLDCGLRWMLERAGLPAGTNAISLVDLLIQLLACVLGVVVVNAINSMIHRPMDTAKSAT